MGEIKEHYMDDINKWADQYEKAQADGVFDDAPMPPGATKQTADVSFFGPANTKPTADINSVDATYWNKIKELSMSDDPTASFSLDSFSDNEELAGEEDKLIQEQTKKEVLSIPMDQPLGDLAKTAADSPNPVEPPSVGKDQRRRVTPNWTDGQELRELDELKRSLYDLEVKLSGPDGLINSGGVGQNNDKVEQQIEALKRDIDELSNTLSPKFWQDIES
jgi:hypothetical protein